MPRTAAALTMLVGALVLGGCSSDPSDVGVPAEPTPVRTTTPVATTSTAPTATRATSAAAPENPDGVTYGLLTAVGADHRITYDKVDFRPTACEARAEEQYADVAATRRVCFGNVNTRERSVTVSRGVVRGTYDVTGGRADYDASLGLDYAALRTSFAESTRAQELPVRLTIDGGAVTRIDDANLLAS